MLQYHIFPGGTRRIVTFSYDDGAPNDARLVELFNAYGVKGTFHLNSISLMDCCEKRKQYIRGLYQGHEIACHTVHHGWPAHQPPQTVIGETIPDRRILEDIAGYPVTGMSYPSGSFDAVSADAMRAAGIRYSRTTKSTGGFDFPENWLLWHPSCHHRDAAKLAEVFLKNIDSEWYAPLFYIWGHSHELHSEEDWEYMEALVSKLAHLPQVWYATNIEIVRYLTALGQLEISVDEKVIYNPTAIDLWLEADKTDIIRIPAGKTVMR